MEHFALLAAVPSVTWFLLPLAVVISLVYSASRHEDPETILYRASRLTVTILLFMGAVFVLLYLLSFRL